MLLFVIIFMYFEVGFVVVICIVSKFVEECKNLFNQLYLFQILYIVIIVYKNCEWFNFVVENIFVCEFVYVYDYVKVIFMLIFILYCWLKKYDCFIFVFDDVEQLY